MLFYYILGYIFMLTAFVEIDRNFLIPDPEAQRYEIANPVNREDGSIVIDDIQIDGVMKMSLSLSSSFTFLPLTTTPSASTAKSAVVRERRSMLTDDEDRLREGSGEELESSEEKSEGSGEELEGSGEELEGSGHYISRGDAGPTTSTTTTTFNIFVPFIGSFGKRIFRVRLTIQKTWSPALDSSSSLPFKAYQLDLEEAFSNSDLDIDYLHVVRFVNINDPAFVQCIFDIGLVGYLRNQVNQELQIIMDVGKVGNIRVRRDGYEIRDIGEPICPETQLRCRNGDCVPSYARCDGVVQCADSSDEEDCYHPSTTIRPPQQPGEKQCGGIVGTDRGNLQVGSSTYSCLWIIELQNTTGVRLELMSSTMEQIMVIPEQNTSETNLQSIWTVDSSAIHKFEGKTLAILLPPRTHPTSLNWTGTIVQGDRPPVPVSTNFSWNSTGKFQWEHTHDGTDKVCWAIQPLGTGQLKWMLKTELPICGQENPCESISFVIFHVPPSGNVSEIIK